MLTGSFVSVGVVLDMVNRDNQFLIEHVDYNDVLEWIIGAIRLIGAPGAYDENKVTGNSMITPNITVVDYRGPLPVDYVQVKPGGVRDYDTKIVYRGATDRFISAPNITGDAPLNQQIDLTYRINDNYIFTSEETATLEMTYRAFKIDDAGLPMVPDDQRYLQAISSFIAERIGYNLYMTDKLTERKYDRLVGERRWYIASASSGARMPDVDTIQSWTNMLVRLSPNLDQFSSSFKYSGNKEDLNV